MHSVLHRLLLPAAVRLWTVHGIFRAERTGGKRVGAALGGDGQAMVAGEASLFVGNLPKEASDEELSACFSAFNVAATAIVCHRGSTRSRCFGFVIFNRAADSNAALAAPCHTLRGKELAVQVATAHDPAWTPRARVRRRRRQLSPGVVWLEHFFDADEQRSLADCALSLDYETPTYATTNRSLKLSMACAGRRWAPGLGYIDERTVSPLPPPLAAAAQRALTEARRVLQEASELSEWCDCAPDIGVCNLYESTGRLGLHQDRDESPASIEAGAPVISLNFGATAVFEYIEMGMLDGACARRGANAQRLGAAELEALPRRSVKLSSGDVLIFGGVSRNIYHGVSTVLPHSCSSKKWNTRGCIGRLNVTLREY